MIFALEVKSGIFTELHHSVKSKKVFTLQNWKIITIKTEIIAIMFIFHENYIKLQFLPASGSWAPTAGGSSAPAATTIPSPATTIARLKLSLTVFFNIVSREPENRIYSISSTLKKIAELSGWTWKLLKNSSSRFCHSLSSYSVILGNWNVLTSPTCIKDDILF